MMRARLHNQYRSALMMFRNCVEQFHADLWLQQKPYKNPAWQVAYHNCIYANTYMSPSYGQIERWSREVTDVENLNRSFPSQTPFTKEEIIDFIDHIMKHIDSYLDSFSPDKPCWANWYQLSQFEFHLNNLRHIQHHTGALIDRLKSKGDVSVEWLSFKE